MLDSPRSRPVVAAVVGVIVGVPLALAAACGASPTPIAFDAPGSSDQTLSTLSFDSNTVPGNTPTSSSDPASAASAAAAEAAKGRWVDVTGNLLGMSSVCGTTTYVTVRPDRDGVITGVAGQGLWTSENGASEWTPLGQGAGSAKITNRPTSLVFDPTDARRFWESGVYEGLGAFETKDGGTTFNGLDVQHSDLVSIDFNDGSRSTLLSGTHEQPDVKQSTNGGQSWASISAGLPPGVGSASFPLVLDAKTYLLGSKAGDGAGVFRTTDGGATWTKVHEGAVSGPPLIAKSDGKIYWLLGTGALISSGDGGVTWADAGSYGPAGGNVGYLLELPDGRLATLGTTNVIVSKDHGASWRAVGATLPIKAAGIAYSPFRQTFYIWRSDCDNSTPNNPVQASSIMRLDDFVDAQ
jgi:photosystem II stability/assembly factor-like uncharacterized protein